jgi:hypothetical protein
MRKPRDIDAELKALSDKARVLKAKQRAQLGELVAATGADALDPETLAGVLLDAVARAKSDAGAKEAWRVKGAGFFRRGKRNRPITPENLAAALELAGDAGEANDGGDAAVGSAGGTDR